MYSHQMIDNVPLGRGSIAEGAGIIKGALRFNPATPIYDEFGNYTMEVTTPNPVSHLVYENLTSIDRLLSTAYLNYRITPNLTFRTQVGFDRNESEFTAYLPTSHQTGASAGGRADINERVNNNYQAQATLNQIWVFGSGELHSLVSTLGTEYMKYKRRGNNIRATGFPFDGALWHNLALATHRPSIGSFSGSDEVISVFGRSTYSFDDKYFITTNLRLDGSSNFAPDHQFGLFPGISAGWDLSRESFMDFYHGWLDQLKLRVGYGITGNDDIGYAFTDWYSPGRNAQFGGNFVAGVRVAGLGNPNLKWEQQEDINVGLDIGLFNGRIYGELDVFSRKISRILGTQPIGTWNPVTSILHNLESVKETYGTEFTLNTMNIATSDLSWNSIMTFTYYRDRWLERDPSYVLSINESPQAYFNEIWRYKSDGLAPLNSDDPMNPIPGTIRILDVDSYLLDEDGNRVMDEEGRPMYAGEPDGRIDAADMVFVGVNQPFTIGFNNTFIYRRFDLSFYAYGMFNQWMENPVYSRLGGYMTYSIIDRGINLHTSVLDRFNHDNLEGTEVSSVDNNTGDWRTRSPGDYYLEKSWFIRLRNITLGYTIETQRGYNIRLYTSADNALLITPYTGMDPETDSYLGSYPPQRTFRFGLQFDL